MTINLFTVCNFNYIDKFNIFFKSYIVNELNKDLVKYNHFFIYKDDSDLENIKNYIKNYFEGYKNIINIIYVKYPRTKTKVAFKNYCCHFRFEGFNILSNLFNDSILFYCDIDAVILNSLKKNINLLSQDYYFFIRKNIKTNEIINLTNIDIKNKNIDIVIKGWRSSILSGVIVIKNNNNGKKLINELNKKINSVEDKNEWFNDQIIMDKIFFDNKFKIGVLDRIYFNLLLEENSIIGLCKGKTYPDTRPEWISKVKGIEDKFNKN